MPRGPGDFMTIMHLRAFSGTAPHPATIKLK
jgi:hypothetical protein